MTYLGRSLGKVEKSFLCLFVWSQFAEKPMATNTQTDTASLHLPDETLELSVVTGSENERGVDISKLRAQTGYITIDDG